MKNPFDEFFDKDPLVLSAQQASIKLNLPKYKERLKEENREKVQNYIDTHKFWTQAEVAYATGLCLRATANYIREIKRDYQVIQKKDQRK